MNTPRQLQELCKEGVNIIKTMSKDRGIDSNTPEIIEVAYDLQTGSYQNKWSKEHLQEHYKLFTKEIANTILSVCNPNSIMEAGIGEATTFSGVLNHFSNNINAYGFDISWSRVSYARKWLKNKNVNLCTGNLFSIPMLDNSIDVVYTFHSIEPNGGNEEKILKELYRVTNNYLILFEPDYEGTNEENKKRMDSFGYCKGLEKLAIKLGYEVVNHTSFIHNLNDTNPTAITIIKKNKTSNIKSSKDIFACPKYKTPLIFDKTKQTYFGPEALCVYPIIDNIPCLRIENGIFASKYEI